MSLPNDVSRCTGQKSTTIGIWVCPVRDACRRYADGLENADIVSWMHPPKIHFGGCELKIETKEKP